MQIATLIARVVLGLVFLVFGLNGFLHFITLASEISELLLNVSTQVRL